MKYNHFSKAELIDMLCMKENLLAKKEEELKEAVSTNELLSKDLVESNRQNTQYEHAIDDVTSDKVAAEEAAKTFRKERNNARTLNWVLAIAIVVMAALWIIL